ncbi:haloacid dehalogenase-like hydrolase [Lentibacillus cibarius]|uniref:phosphoserine phosphatase n=1 Tax=Lentibacillus cibarius TaxID=2583219 RepID=A0A5S3QL03_9BACI|nr:haloacid dehalogenase-like hydrolase [Lentibacillus cibarius]TMN22614.1 haloacid dehalogenase-like hydrolase [Lentibacillus cibarius]
MIFDWDNTCIFHDAEEALFLYQIDHLAFKLTPSQFESIIKRNVTDNSFSDDYRNTDGGPVTLKSISKDLERDYCYLYDHYEKFKGSEPLEEIRLTDYFKDFKVKLYFLYAAIGGTYGPEVAYPWMQRLFTNMTVQEVQKLAETSNDFNLGQALANVHLTSPELLSGSAGKVVVYYVSGLRVISEISNLMNTFRKRGIDVFIVSASMEEIVEVFAANPKYGYGLPKENVFGTRLRKKNGIMQSIQQDNWPVAAHHGKTLIIRREIAAKRNGTEPLLVAGDSSSDYEMLTEFKNMKLGLIINCLQKGNIADLSEKCSLEIKESGPTYALQGRNENTGLLHLYESTTKLGTNEIVLLPDR